MKQVEGIELEIEDRKNGRRRNFLFEAYTPYKMVRRSLHISFTFVNLV